MSSSSFGILDLPPNLYQGQGGYFLCVYVRIDTIKLAVVRIIISIS